MIASRTELEQMARDGKGRASVVQALARAALSGEKVEVPVDLQTKKELAQIIERMIVLWPGTISGLLLKARDVTNWKANLSDPRRQWWLEFRENLKRAAREMAAEE